MCIPFLYHYNSSFVVPLLMPTRNTNIYVSPFNWTNELQNRQLIIFLGSRPHHPLEYRFVTKGYARHTVNNASIWISDQQQRFGTNINHFGGGEQTEDESIEGTKPLFDCKSNGRRIIIILQRYFLENNLLFDLVTIIIVINQRMIVDIQRQLSGPYN